MQFTKSMIALVATLSLNIVFAAPVAEPSSIDTNALVARSEGWWQVENRCGFTIYYQSVNEGGVVVSNGYVEPGTTTLGSYAGNEDGLSVKLCTSGAGCSNPYQFETTVKGNLVYYDLSAVNGDPLSGQGRGVYPSDGSGPTYWCDANTDSTGCEFTDPTNGPVGAASLSAVIIAQFCY